MSYLVFDIETVPDLSVWTPPAPEAPPPDPAATLPGQLTLVPGPGLPGAPPAGPPPNATGAIVIPPIGTPAKRARKPRQKKVDPSAPPKDPFAPLYAHRVVAIGFAILDDELLHVQQLGCVGTRTFGDNEAALLEAWDKFVIQQKPTIVTFAGRGFEVPVLGLRALRLGIAQSWADNEYRHRYGSAHLDLFDLFTEHGIVPRTGFSLDTFSRLVGLPGKNGVDGASVAAMFAKGEAEKIEAYCTCDVARTAFLLLRYFLMRGRLSTEKYQAAARKLLETCATQQLGAVTFGVDTKRLLLEG